MYIDPKSKIADYPALLVRKAMKYIAHGEVSKYHFSHYLETSDEEAEKVIIYLIENGFLEKGRTHEKVLYYSSTIKGNSLAMASAAKPITRETADKKIAELLERVKIINSSEEYLYRVKRIRVFGSYLSEQEKINDVDLSIELETKFPELSGDKRMALEKKRTEKAESKGKVFYSYIDSLTWAFTEVQMFLKSKSRTLSMHYEDEIIKQTENKVIFEI